LKPKLGLKYLKPCSVHYCAIALNDIAYLKCIQDELLVVLISLLTPLIFDSVLINIDDILSY